MFLNSIVILVVLIYAVIFKFVTEVDLNDESTKDESYDFRFVKWLIKEKVQINLGC